MLARIGAGQDLEPRAYSAAPVGANFLVAAYVYSTGDVVTDPSLPVTDIQAHIHGFAAGYGRTFALFGRQALATVALPYAFGDVSGNVGENRLRVTRSGLVDLKGKFSINLYGNPAMGPREFAARPRSVLVGASLVVSAPTGKYDETKLINLGTNRWAFKPEIGVSVPWKGFDFDAYAGVVFFTENSHFYPGASTKTQDPLTTFQLHASYTVRPGLWAAIDGTWYGGGASHVNDGPGTMRLANSRFGATISIPVAKKQSVKVAFSRGAFVRFGSNFTTVGASWQLLWF